MLGPPIGKMAKDICPDEWLDPKSSEGLIYIFICICICLFGGIMSGLTQSMTQLDHIVLKGFEKEGTETEKVISKLLLPFVHRKHLTLVTLLVANACAMEALPIFLDVLMPKYYAILISVSLVVVFGEIIPQALCMKWPYQISAVFSWLVWMLMVVFGPVAYPISALLDHLLGLSESKNQNLNRAGLFELTMAMSNRDVLLEDEVAAITGVLQMHDKKSCDVFVPLVSTFMLDYDTVLDEATLILILREGMSRVPVFYKKRTIVVGMVLTRNLARVNPSKKMRLADFPLHPLLVVAPDQSLFALLSQFRSGRSHMAVVSSDYSQSSGKPHYVAKNYAAATYLERVENVLGVVTIEDVIECMLQRDIIDETDRWQNASQGLEEKLQSIATLRKELGRVLSSYGKNIGAHRGSRTSWGHTSPQKAEVLPLLAEVEEAEVRNSEKSSSGRKRSPSGDGYGSLNEFHRDENTSIDFDGSRRSSSGSGGKSDSSLLMQLQQV